MVGLFKRGDSPNWWYRIQFEGKVWTASTETADKKLAERIYLEKRRQVVECRNFPSQSGKYVKLSEMARHYMEKHAKVNKRSWKDDAAHIQRFLTFFGDRPLNQVTPQRIEEYKASRKNYVKDATINRELACLKSIFSKAVLWGYAGDNPVKKVKFFREELKPVKVLTSEERRRLLDCCPAWLRPIVVAALKTGMRKGEIRNLRWADVDLTNNNIHVRRTKSGKMRIVPIHPELYEVLKELRPRRNSEYVFIGERGQKLEEGSQLRTSFEAAVRKAELGTFTFHDLRHNFASELVMKGADLRTVQEYLGHSTLMMVQRYSHLSESIRRSTIQLLGRDLPTSPATASSKTFQEVRGKKF
jgi:integrase